MSPSKRTALTRVPRASHRPGVPLRAVPCHVQARPSVLVAYSVVIWSACCGSSSGWHDAHRCQRPSWYTITGSLTAVLASPGSTVCRPRVRNSAGWAASVISTRQCLVPVVAQLRYSRQRPSGVRTRAGRSSDSVAISSLPMVSSVSNRSPSTERATATA